jgi:hypothetical protein
MFMRYLIPTALSGASMLLASSAFADPCTDVICSLAGRASSSLGEGGVIGLLALAAVIGGVWFYRRRD